MPVDRSSVLRVCCARTSSRDSSNLHPVPLDASQTLDKFFSGLLVPTLFPLQPLFPIRAEVAALEIQI